MSQVSLAGSYSVVFFSPPPRNQDLLKIFQLYTTTSSYFQSHVTLSRWLSVLEWVESVKNLHKFFSPKMTKQKLVYKNRWSKDKEKTKKSIEDAQGKIIQAIICASLQMNFIRLAKTAASWAAQSTPYSCRDLIRTVSFTSLKTIRMLLVSVAQVKWE